MIFLFNYYEYKAYNDDDKFLKIYSLKNLENNLLSRLVYFCTIKFRL